MLLILVDSFAYWAGTRDLGPDVVARGWRGARLANEEFRRWAINVTHQERPRDVLLIVGGNDVACAHFSPRLLGKFFEELILGIYAAGAEYVHVLYIPPRSATRPGSATVSVYRRRRRLIIDVETAIPPAGERQRPAVRAARGRLVARFSGTGRGASVPNWLAGPGAGDS